MSETHDARLEALVGAFVTGPGDTEPDDRRSALEAGERIMRGEEVRAGALAADVEAVLRKVVLRPYTVTDQEIEALRAAGWSDNALFELVAAAAIGAGRAVARAGMRVTESL